MAVFLFDGDIKALPAQRAGIRAGADGNGGARGIDRKNRLNVAISRAKCLAIFIANPALMAIRCSNPEEMAMVNTLCWIQEVGKQ